VKISELGYIHDSKLGKIIHNNGSNYMPASGQTIQAVFLMAIQHGKIRAVARAGRKMT